MQSGVCHIEKIIFNQLYEYLTINNLLAESISQHGFRPQHSTVTALLEATNNWYLNIDNGLLNGALFLDLKKLQKLQNRAARVITSCEGYSIRSANILHYLGWETLENRRSKLLAVSVYKCMNGFYPEGISAMFDSTASVHSYNLRGSLNNIFITRPHTEAGKKAFSYRGAVLWNSLPSDLRNQPNLKSFKDNFINYSF